MIMRYLLFLLLFLGAFPALAVESPFMNMPFADRVERDDEIHHEVRRAIAENPMLLPFVDQINVLVVNGVVTITGTVETARERSELTRSVQWIYGVRKVVNNVEVALQRTPVYPYRYENPPYRGYRPYDNPPYRGYRRFESPRYRSYRYDSRDRYSRYDSRNRYYRDRYYRNRQYYRP
jgi:hypothetical protein